MDEQSLFTGFWTSESKTTRNVLARIPEGSDYRPDPKSRTAKDIAWQIVCEEKMLITTYLRPMGSTVPQIYGPSADEP